MPGAQHLLFGKGVTQRQHPQSDQCQVERSWGNSCFSRYLVDLLVQTPAGILGESFSKCGYKALIRGP